MKGWIRWTRAVCVVALVLGGSFAHASSSGTITFVGAIVATTCDVADAMPMAPNGSRGSCGVTPEQPSTHATLYRQDVQTLESAVASRDRLLVYFASYAHGADVQVMTRTYE